MLIRDSKHEKSNHLDYSNMQLLNKSAVAVAEAVLEEVALPVPVDVSLDELLTDVLGLVEPDTTLEVVIIGVSDCVGPIVAVAICDKEYESEGDAEVDTVDVLLTDGICVNDIREVLE
jgi:hypothetical protein